MDIKTLKQMPITETKAYELQVDGKQMTLYRVDSPGNCTMTLYIHETEEMLYEHEVIDQITDNPKLLEVNED
tara:strand:- start:980 stop:1195 length:216 start_codon:yes stop_codon:yes gene_type:complete